MLGQIISLVCLFFHQIFPGLKLIFFRQILLQQVELIGFESEALEKYDNVNIILKVKYCFDVSAETKSSHWYQYYSNYNGTPFLSKLCQDCK